MHAQVAPLETWRSIFFDIVCASQQTRERSSRPSETCNAEEPEGPEERRCCGEGQTAPLVACVVPDNSGGVHCAVPLAGLLPGLHISLRLRLGRWLCRRGSGVVWLARDVVEHVHHG